MKRTHEPSEPNEPTPISAAVTVAAQRVVAIRPSVRGEVSRLTTLIQHYEQQTALYRQELRHLIGLVHDIDLVNEPGWRLDANEGVLVQYTPVGVPESGDPQPPDPDPAA